MAVEDTNYQCATTNTTYHDDVQTLQSSLDNAPFAKAQV